MKHHPSSRAAGFTLVEMLVAVGVAGILSSVAYPSFTDQVHRARRSDALVALMQAQGAQERWRANHRDYGSLAEIGMPAASPAGHYRLAVVEADDEHFVLQASATGGQARDTMCRHLRLTMDGATLRYASGADTDAANSATANRRCWNQ